MALRETFKEIADAIRAKEMEISSSQGTMKPTEMATRISDLEVAKKDPMVGHPLTFSAISTVPVTVKIVPLNADVVPTRNIQLVYSTDKGSTWTDYILSGTSQTTIVAPIVMIRAKDGVVNEAMGGTSSSGTWKFNIVGDCSLSGDIGTLIEKDGGPERKVPNFGFRYLFNGCSSIKYANNLVLPYAGNAMGANCYERMFNDCSGMLFGPTSLPNIYLSNCCYMDMFTGCSSMLAAVVDLNAPTLGSESYRGMFYNCTSMVRAPRLHLTSLGGSDKARGLYGMFNGCSSLHLIELDYLGNFDDGVHTDAFTNWVRYIPATGTIFYRGSDTTTGYSAIPTGWTVVPPSILTSIKGAATAATPVDVSYIDTDIIPASTDIVETKVRFDRSTNQNIWCSRADINTSMFCGFLVDGQLRFDRNNRVSAMGDVISLDTDYEIVANYDTLVVKVNGSSVGTMTSGEYSTANPITLFQSYTSGQDTTHQNPSGMKLYYFRIKDKDGNLKHNLLPARMGSDIGMYDVVTNVFYRNSGSTPFIAET